MTFQWYIRQEQMENLHAQRNHTSKLALLHDLLLSGESKMLQKPAKSAPEEAFADYEQNVQQLEGSAQWERIDQDLVKELMEEVVEINIGESFRLVDPSNQIILSVTKEPFRDQPFVVLKNRYRN